MTRAFLYFAMLFSIACVVFGDVYMQSPKGSNNRNRERNGNRNNANRLFDSQNNGAGGYPWPGDNMLKASADPVTYFSGSEMTIQWTNQHACNNPTTHCTIVAQYTCDDISPGLRDGYPTGDYQAQPNGNQNWNPPGPDYLDVKFQANGANGVQGTDRIPNVMKDNQGSTFCLDANVKANEGYKLQTGGVGSQRGECSGKCNELNTACEYGQHEDYFYYLETCQQTERNKGLYTADRNLNKNDRRSTRQNPNGGRRGLECPEERDYYPWWGQSPWVDIAVLTSQQGWCNYYKTESQNVKPRYYCDMTVTNNNLRKITEQECKTAQGVWRKYKAWNEIDPLISQPDCKEELFTQQNHLGYNSAGSMPNYTWTVPEITGSKQCVLRLRYNISTDDYKSMAGFGDLGDDLLGGKIVDNRYNCDEKVNESPESNDPNVNDPDSPGSGSVAGSCANSLVGDNRPLYNRPELGVFKETEAKIAIALNTDQSGRTFQDRSYVFKISGRDQLPAEIPKDAKIVNIYTMGKRGNIVQAYPAIEHRFAPETVNVPNGAYLRFITHGSMYNENRNPNNAEGWRYSGHSNLIETNSPNHNFPREHINLKGEYVDAGHFFDEANSLTMGLLGQKDRLKAGLYKDAADANANVKSTYKCYNVDEVTQKDDHPLLCGKMNAAAMTFEHFAKATKSGTSYFVSTRNNNFSNRNQKLTVTVGQPTSGSSASVAGAVIGSMVGIGAVAFGVVCLLALFGVISLPFIKPMKKKKLGDESKYQSQPRDSSQDTTSLKNTKTTSV